MTERGDRIGMGIVKIVVGITIPLIFDGICRLATMGEGGFVEVYKSASYNVWSGTYQFTPDAFGVAAIGGCVLIPAIGFIVWGIIGDLIKAKNIKNNLMINDSR